jgi:hypothetical protein
VLPLEKCFRPTAKAIKVVDSTLEERGAMVCGESLFSQVGTGDLKKNDPARKKC